MEKPSISYFALEACVMRSQRIFICSRKTYCDTISVYNFRKQ